MSQVPTSSMPPIGRLAACRSISTVVGFVLYPLQKRSRVFPRLPKIAAYLRAMADAPSRIDTIAAFSTGKHFSCLFAGMVGFYCRGSKEKSGFVYDE
jgi:hypothetical protein